MFLINLGTSKFEALHLPEFPTFPEACTDIGDVDLVGSNVQPSEVTGEAVAVLSEKISLRFLYLTAPGYCARQKTNW